MSALDDQVRKRKFTVVIVALVVLFVLLGTAPTHTEIWGVVMNPTSTEATAVVQASTATQTQPAAVTSTPTPLPATATATPTSAAPAPTAPATATPTPLPPTATPEPTPSHTPTAAATQTPTAPVPSPTPTPRPPTATPEPTPSHTPTAAATRTPTPDTSLVHPVPKSTMPVTGELAVPAITTPEEDLETQETGVAIGGTSPASASVVLYDNEAPVGLVIADGEGRWQYEPPEPWAEAEHVFVARTTDGERISEPSEPVRVVVLGEQLPVTGKSSAGDPASGWSLLLRQLGVLALIAVAALLGLRRSD